MEKYLLIKLVFADAILGELHDILLDEYPRIAASIENFADSIGTSVLFESTVNSLPIGRSFATVESNFSLSDAEKEKLAANISEFFLDGEIKWKTMNTYNTLAAVRFLKVDGEL